MASKGTTRRISVAACALLGVAGIALHLLAPSRGWGLFGTLGGAVLATLAGVVIMGRIHGRRHACPSCEARLPFGPADGHETRIVRCEGCRAELYVTSDGLTVLPDYSAARVLTDSGA